jgi:CRP/FNR family cyclic AMP-dependent transcriptional regulator
MQQARAPGPPDGLAAHPFFRTLAPGAAHRHLQAATWLAGAPGTLLVDFDDISDDVFFVLAGTVRITVRTPGGRELILDDIGAGGFFGEMAAIDGAPRSAAVTALHRCRICRLPGPAFMALLAEAPELARRMMRLLAGRVRDANARLLERSALDIRHRLHAELLRLAGPAMPDGARAISPPPVQHVLASRIGARREPVSREIARLVRAGVLQRTRGALILRTPAALADGLARARDR